MVLTFILLLHVHLFSTIFTVFLGRGRAEQNSDDQDGEVLHHSSERIRMKLIRDFRLLESMNELETEMEPPKYHAQDIEDEKRRTKLLTENPHALVKFHAVRNVVRENPKYKNWNETQQKRLHRIKYRLAKKPPLDFIANNIVESKFFKNIIKFMIHVNLWTILIQTSLLTEFRHSPERKPPAGVRRVFHETFCLS